MLEEAPHIRNGVQLSMVQGYLSKFYRLLSEPLIAPANNFNCKILISYTIWTGDMEHWLHEILPSYFLHLYLQSLYFV